MKNDILQIIKNKKTLFKQEVNDGIRELQKVRDEANKKDKKEGALFAMERIPTLQTKIVSGKVVVAVLTEIEKDINDLREPIN